MPMSDSMSVCLSGDTGANSFENRNKLLFTNNNSAISLAKYDNAYRSLLLHHDSRDTGFCLLKTRVSHTFSKLSLKSLEFQILLYILRRILLQLHTFL